MCDVEEKEKDDDENNEYDRVVELEKKKTRAKNKPILFDEKITLWEKTDNMYNIIIYNVPNG